MFTQISSMFFICLFVTGNCIDADCLRPAFRLDLQGSQNKVDKYILFYSKPRPEFIDLKLRLLLEFRL